MRSRRKRRLLLDLNSTFLVLLNQILKLRLYLMLPRHLLHLYHPHQHLCLLQRVQRLCTCLIAALRFRPVPALGAKVRGPEL